MRDLFNSLDVAQVLDPVNVTADKISDRGADLKGYEGALAVVAVGVTGDTLDGSNFISLELEESEDDSTFTDVAVEDMIGGVQGSSGQFALINAAAEDDTAYAVGYIGTKRYIHVVVNVTGTHTNGTPVGAVVVRGHKRHKVGPAV